MWSSVFSVVTSKIVMWCQMHLSHIGIEYARQTLIIMMAPLSCFLRNKGSSWSFSSWIFNYLCNRCLSPLSSNLVICNCFHLSITQCVYDVSRPREILLSLQSQDQNLKGQEDQEYYPPLQGDWNFPHHQGVYHSHNNNSSRFQFNNFHKQFLNHRTVHLVVTNQM